MPSHLRQKTLTLTLALAAGGLVASGTTMAQSPGAQQDRQQDRGGQRGAPPGGMPNQDVELNEQTKQQFKEANQELESIREEFTPKIQEADNREKAQELQQKAQSEMVDAVKEAGLSVSEYNQIVNMVERDPQLREELLGSGQR